jgi:hypothetical protein
MSVRARIGTSGSSGSRDALSASRARGDYLERPRAAPAKRTLPPRRPRGWWTSHTAHDSEPDLILPRGGRMDYPLTAAPRPSTMMWCSSAAGSSRHSSTRQLHDEHGAASPASSQRLSPPDETETRAWLTKTPYDPAHSFPAGYMPDRVWSWDKSNGGRFANINRPSRARRMRKTCRSASTPLQLYSLGTPNGSR